jgi:tetratricopeptide (TPR) repeat protein
MIGSLTLAVLLVSTAQSPAQVSADRQRAEMHYNEGWQALKAESWDEAAKEFKAAIDLYPRLTLAYYGLGRAEMGRKHFPDAIHAYEQCRDFYVRAAGQQFTANADAMRARQDQQMELKDAIRQVSSGPQTQRSQETVRQFQNQMRLNQQNMDRGMNVSIDASVPAFVSVALGSAYFRAERVGDAEREYKTAVTNDPKLGEAWNNLAVVYATANRYDEAERSVKAAEKAGYHVNPNLKDEISRKKNGS